MSSTDGSKYPHLHIKNLLKIVNTIEYTRFKSTAVESTLGFTFLSKGHKKGVEKIEQFPKQITNGVAYSSFCTFNSIYFRLEPKAPESWSSFCKMAKAISHERATSRQSFDLFKKAGKCENG